MIWAQYYPCHRWCVCQVLPIPEGRLAQVVAEVGDIVPMIGSYLNLLSFA